MRWSDRRVRKACRHLDRLALALVDTGWAALTRYEERPPLLRVFDARVPLVGESVSATRGPCGGWWFYSSLGLPLGSCGDVESAVVHLGLLLGPVVVAMLDGEPG